CVLVFAQLSLRGTIFTFSALAFSFYVNGRSPTVMYPLSLHDALPIYQADADRKAEPGGQTEPERGAAGRRRGGGGTAHCRRWHPDRKSTRLNSSHVKNSYAVFCLKKKMNKVCTSRREQADKVAHATYG